LVRICIELPTIGPTIGSSNTRHDRWPDGKNQTCQVRPIVGPTRSGRSSDRRSGCLFASPDRRANRRPDDQTVYFPYKTRTDVAFIAFSKAFDKVSHNKLLHKLKSYGIAGNLLLIIFNFLSDRHRCTRVRTRKYRLDHWYCAGQLSTQLLNNFCVQ